jgi:riboflavin biosynthesis pyrimidine reductase
MRQVFPVVIDPVDPVDVYRDRPGAGPFLRLNMIASVDGATALAGLSGGLGGAADHRVFMALRSLADAVLVAAGTMRAEGYGPAVLPPEIREARRARGQAPVPPIAVVSRSCNLDWESPFFTAATVTPIVVTVAAAPAGARARAGEVADVVLAGDDDVDLARAVDALAERGFSSVLAEGGPSFNGQLAGAGLLDELCLTLSPWLVGGEARRILAGPALPVPLPVAPASVCEEDGFLFLRFAVPQTRASTAQTVPPGRTASGSSAGDRPRATNRS